jgi:hypothetical protein
MGAILFGYMLSSANASGQKTGLPVDVAVFPISGHTNKTIVTQSRWVSSQVGYGIWKSSQTEAGFRTNYIGAIACCMFKYNYATNKWIPYS